MQRRWTGKNVNLDLLSQSIEDFFKSKGFVTGRTELKREFTIVWTSMLAPYKLKDFTRTKVFGDSNDFTVEIIASELTTRAIRMGLLTKSIGGGYFALRNIRLRETLEKLESDFWIFVEGKIADLERSASD
jgi:hypothetical protein